MLQFKLECKRLFSGTVNKLVLALFLISGLVAIYQGAQGYKSQRVDQYKSTVVFQKEREYVANRETLPEPGSIAYYASAPTQWQLSPWAALFVGESQHSMVATKVKALALQGQIFNREIVNPAQQRTGGLDLGFVLVYLLPIVIGIVTVTLISDEQHAGRWRLLSALPIRAYFQVYKQLGLRFAVIWLLAAVLLISAAALLSLPFDGTFWLVCAAITLYMLFWFSLAGLIMSLGKSSVVNSLAYLSGWVIFAILIPGAIHLYLSNSYQTNTPLEISLKQRLIMNDGWDQNQQAALDEFLNHEPQWQSTAPLGDTFDWKWYFAQQHLSDIAVDEQWQGYLQNRMLRHQQLQKLSWLSPALMLQFGLNQLAHTSSYHQTEYFKEIAHYHQQIRHFFYDFMFFDKAVTKEDILNFPLYKNQPQTPSQSFVSLIFATLLVFGLAIFAARRLTKLKPI